MGRVHEETAAAGGCFPHGKQLVQTKSRVRPLARGPKIGTVPVHHCRSLFASGGPLSTVLDGGGRRFCKPGTGCAEREKLAGRPGAIAARRRSGKGRKERAAPAQPAKICKRHPPTRSIDADRFAGANGHAGPAIAAGRFVDDGLAVGHGNGIKWAGRDAFFTSGTLFRDLLSLTSSTSDWRWIQETPYSFIHENTTTWPCPVLTKLWGAASGGGRKIGTRGRGTGVVGLRCRSSHPTTSNYKFTKKKRKRPFMAWRRGG